MIILHTHSCMYLYIDKSKELGGMDGDFHVREEDTKHSMQSMLQSFEEKQMREVKVLVKCGKTLDLGARNMLKQRRSFAKKAKRAPPPR